MQKNNRYLYTVFMCQQALEKLLKAIHIHQTSKEAPRTHNLVYVVGLLNLPSEPEHLKTMATCNCSGARHFDSPFGQIYLTTKSSLTSYIKDLAQIYQIERAILYGSYAQGTIGKDSDIDIAIFASDATDENRLEIMADCWLKTILYKLDIQPVVYPTADYEADNDFIQQEIIAKGIEIPVPKTKSKVQAGYKTEVS